MNSSISARSLPSRTHLNTSLAILAALTLAPMARADDWPQWLGPQRDGIWRETGIVTKFPAGGPPVRWRTPIAAGYAGPAVAEGRVYVTDRVVAKGACGPGIGGRGLRKGHG